MGSPQPSTSDAMDSILLDEGDELNEYGKETYTLLKYVLQEISAEKNQNVKKEFPLERAHRYTGLQIDFLETLSYKDVTIVDKITEINRKCVHDALMSFYLNANFMPTTTELFSNIQKSLPVYEDIRSFRKRLVKMGYIFKKIAASFVVYEKPSIRFERFLYLKNILQYRQDKRPIYYISELGTSYNKVWNVDESLLEKKEKQHRFYFAVSSHKGLEFLKKVRHFDTLTFNLWILNEVIPYLEINSVVILDNSKHHCDKYCETPKKTSPSDIMIQWLTLHEIPFNDTMSIVELYSLIEKYTDVHRRLNKVDIWLKENGHDVLRLPDCINELTLAAQVRNLITKSLQCKEVLLTEAIEDIAVYITVTELYSYNLMLAKEELRLYNIEVDVDKVLDNLKPSFNIENDLYLPSLSDSD